MKGQVFTIDLFTAYGVFLVVLLTVTMMSFFLMDTIITRDKLDGMSNRATNGLDYLCYGDNFSYEPYQLKTESIQWFFSQGDSYIIQELRPGWNHSLQLKWLNGTTVFSSGGESVTANQVVSFERVVYYNNERAKLEMILWDER